MRAVIFILITLFELNQCLRINIDAHSVVKEDSTASASTERGREGKDDDDDGDDGDDDDDDDDDDEGIPAACVAALNANSACISSQYVDECINDGDEDACAAFLSASEPPAACVTDAILDACGDWESNGGGAVGDPRVTNVAGKTFDILALGTLPLLRLAGKSSPSQFLAITAAIDRVGRGCTQTFIQNLTITGKWIEDSSSESVVIRAVSQGPKEQALQVKSGGSWQSAAEMPISKLVAQAIPQKIMLKTHGVSVEVWVDDHHGNDGTFNFLNLNVQGLGAWNMRDIHIGGLLGNDDITEATRAPSDCIPGSSMLALGRAGVLSNQSRTKMKIFTRFLGKLESSKPHCLSVLRASH